MGERKKLRRNFLLAVPPFLAVCISNIPKPALEPFVHSLSCVFTNFFNDATFRRNTRIFGLISHFCDEGAHTPDAFA